MAFKAGTATYVLLDGVNGAGTNSDSGTTRRP